MNKYYPSGNAAALKISIRLTARLPLVALALAAVLCCAEARAEDLFTAEFYLQGSSPRQLIFRQYNEIIKKDGIETLRHVYTLPDGKPAAIEEVVKKNEEFSGYTLRFYQMNCGCRLIREGNKVYFTFLEAGSEKKGARDYSPNLVMGPTLQDFARGNWDRLDRGGKAPFFIPVMDRKILAPFTLRKIGSSPYNRPGVMVVEMKIDSFLLGFLIDPNQLVFDRNTRRLMEIHGPTLLRREVNGKMEATRADIYYRYK
mgnify:CR=1 FL=1